jgi:hypothetical protein
MGRTPPLIGRHRAGQKLLGFSNRISSFHFFFLILKALANRLLSEAGSLDKLLFVAWHCVLF